MNECPLKLFSLGNDYIQIAEILNLSEAEVERQIHILRNEERGKFTRKAKRRIYMREYMRKVREELREMRSRA